jgi:hypothetical protein
MAYPNLDKATQPGGTGHVVTNGEAIKALASMIAVAIVHSHSFPEIRDLLIEFANEIKRQSIEP